ncbi:hypothetical protein KL949_002806 [Ogataea haglerorum]|nr:hypothetical protein KL913_002336 [Ogataea haglerorum]KAG7718810.1 hypothetical protein KL949_002806 [Ogataea haglerorum]KAG7766881.1 hypothetical protein KL931_003765 [Ogataea haglerorum]
MNWLRLAIAGWLFSSAAMSDEQLLSVEESIAIFKEDEPALRESLWFINDYHPGQNDQVHLALDVDYYDEADTIKKKYWHSKLSERQLRALDSLHRLADEHNDIDATYLLAQITLFGNYSLPTNATETLHYHQKIVQLAPNATSNYLLGFIYATGLFGKLDMDQGKALIHYQVAADQGEIRAAMALAYRYYKGISVEQNLMLALYYYGMVAHECFEFIKNGPIGGPNIDHFNFRIYDLQGGLYGSGASETTPLVPSTLKEVVEYEDFTDVDFQSSSYKDKARSVRYYYDGNYWRPRDYHAAFEVAQECATRGIQLRPVEDVLDGRIDRKLSVSRTLIQSVGQCCSDLGHMYLRGEGTEVDLERARVWLERGVKLANSAEASVDLGLLYELMDDEEHHEQAFELYNSARYASARALYHRAKILIRSDFDAGLGQLITAAYRNVPEAKYQVAQMKELQYEPGKEEGIIVFYKAFVEHMEPVVCDLQWAFHQLLNRNHEQALIGYAMAAEQGFEPAQSSTAFLLYSPVGYLEEPPRVPFERFQSSLNYYRRAHQQQNLDAGVFLGDIYYNGLKNSQIGKSSEDGEYAVEPDYNTAFSYYLSASAKGSLQARFNLGYMYEMGIGLSQDFHLAKRYYDQMFEINQKPSLAAQLSLLRLWLKIWWYGEKTAEDPDVGQSTSRTWDDWVQMYTRLRNERRETFAQEQLANGPSRAEPDSNFIFESTFENGNADIFFLIAFASIFLLVMLNRWRLLRQRRPGEPDDEPEDEPNVRFRVILL